MKTNVVSRVLAVIGCVALSVTVAHAGSGQGGGGNNLLGFQCYQIDGVNQQRVVSLDDQFGIRDKIRVGKGQLLCAPVTATLAEGEFDLIVDPVTGDPLPADHLKCYDLSRPRPLNPAFVVRLIDQFDIEILEVSVPVMLCVVTNKTVVGP